MSGTLQRQTPYPVTKASPAATRLLQRCSCGSRSTGQGECTSCKQRKRRLSRRAKSGDVDLDAPLNERVNDVLRRSGQPLEAKVRAVMERRFGRDFSQVRVHTDAAAAETAIQLAAEAYTVGRHLIFAPGRYAPSLPEGRRLLAHELTHVLQQEHAADAAGADLEVGAVDDAFEREADRVADAVAAEPDGLAPAVIAPSLSIGSAPAIQRKACGPKVDKQVKDLWSKIETDFSKLNDDDAYRSCRWLIDPLKPNPAPDAKPRQIPVPIAPIPFVKPLWTPKIETTITWNVDAFDSLPLFYGGAIYWLMNDKMRAKGCCDPSISEAEADWPYQKKCEDGDGLTDPQTCCSSVEIGGKCWLSGTVNYGTYGIMVRACHNRFPIKLAEIYYRAKYMAKAYKSMGHRSVLGGATTKEANVDDPMSWFEATYANGPGGTSSRAGNRSYCGLTCPLDGSIQPVWDYVWEPIKKRSGANFPVTPNIP